MTTMPAHPGRNIGFDLLEHARRQPFAPALILGDRSLTYAELDALVWRCARLLADAGARPGVVLGLALRSELPFVLALLAATRLGVTFTVMSASLSERERVRVDLVLRDPGAADAQSTGRGIELDLRAIGSRPADPDAGLMPAFPEHPWQHLVGSGSTGKPKVMPITHRVQNARAVAAAAVRGLRASDRFLTLPGLETHFARTQLFYALHAGAAFALLRERSPAQAIDLCRRDAFTILDATVPHLEAMLAAVPQGGEAAARQALGSVRMLMVTSSAIPDDLRRRVRDRLTDRLVVLYSTNESSPISMAAAPDLFGVPGTVGRVLPGVEIRILDNDDAPVPEGGVGILEVKSSGVIEGYLDDPEATRRAFRQGWFRTGDLVRRLGDGQLVYCGRADHMMIMNGINIHPAEIERAMHEHPAVLDAAAVPLRHPVHQDIPACVVALRPGARVTEAALIEFGARRLGIRRPRIVVVLDRIPRNAQGKLERAQAIEAVRARLVAGTVAPAIEPFGNATADGTSPVEGASSERPRGRASPNPPPMGVKQARDDPAPVTEDPSSGAAQAVPPRTFPGLAAGQPEHSIDLTVEVPADWRPEGVECWVRDVLGVEPTGALHVEPGVEAGEAVVFLDRALAMALELMRVASVPVFQPARLLALRGLAPPDPHGSKVSWNAVLAVPAVDLIPRQFTRMVLSQALRICAGLHRLAVDAESVRSFSQNIRATIVAPHAHLWSRGKSTVPLLRSAHERGIPYFHLGRGAYQLGVGASGRQSDRSTVESDSAIGARLSQDKATAAQLLRMAGLPAPQHRIVRDAAGAEQAATALGWPVVVKPADRDRGEGVEVNVGDVDTLRAAFTRALELSRSRRVIVERQVPGVCHRLFLAGGRLLYAVARHPMSLTGDGLSTLRALADAQAAREAVLPDWRRSGMAPLDDLARASMMAAGFDEDSVPAPGVRVPLRPIESTAWGGVDEDVTDRVHPENLRVALAAAGLFGLTVAGIDIIAEDISVPWTRSGAIVNEVNYAPLLGGGEISRSRIPEFLDRLWSAHPGVHASPDATRRSGGSRAVAAVPAADGRIPIELFVGGQGAWGAARERQAELIRRGFRAWAVCPEATLDAQQTVVPMALPGRRAFARARAVALSREVEAILIAAPPAEAVAGRWPIEYLDRVVPVDPD